MTQGLGSTGNHASVFQIGKNDSESGVCIMNACLAFIHCHMSSRDKNYIKGKVTSSFSLDQLKEARERLFKYAEPTKEYGYRGPNGKNDRNRLNDAFDGIYTKLVKLDAEDKMPIFSVPSSDLLKLLTITSHEKEPTNYDEKFLQISKDIDELKQTFHSVVTVITSTSQPPPAVKSIPPSVRQRLLSTGSKRSASDMSDEDEISHIETDTQASEGYTYPRQHRRKVKRTKPSSPDSSKPSYSSMAQKKKEKPPSTWGKMKSTSSFRGAVPDVFIYNCHSEVTKEDISDWCQMNNIGLKSIEKKSHQLARRTSFVLSVDTKDNYDLILDGSILPEGVAARKFIPPKWKPEEKSNITNSQFRAAINSSEVQQYLKEMDDLTSGKDNMDVTHAQSSTNQS